MDASVRERARAGARVWQLVRWAALVPGPRSGLRFHAGRACRLLSSCGHVVAGNGADAEASELPHPDDWARGFRACAGRHRTAAAGADGARARARHLLVLAEGCGIHVSLHLVPRHVPAVSLRSADAPGVEVHDPAGNRGADPDGRPGGDAVTVKQFLRKVLLIDLLQGMSLTFRYQDPKEIYTEQYPLQRPEVAERYRGAPRLNVNPDTNETLCIACDLCALACPEHLIVVTSERNEKTRRKELTTFTYDLSRCMFCGLCEDACPTDALELTQDFELANYTREGAIWDRQTLEQGLQPTVYKR